MIPLLLLGIGGLGLLALSRGTAKETEEKKTVSTIKIDDEKDEKQRRAALALLNYVNQKNGRNSKKIKAYQRAIGARKTGKPDAQTEKKVEAILGYNITWKPARKIVRPKVFTQPTTKTVEKKAGPLEQILSSLAGKPIAPKKVVRPTAKAVPSKPPTESSPKSLTQTIKKIPSSSDVSLTVPDSVKSAAALDDYLRSGGFDRTRVKDYQRRMGGISIDGVPGPKTKARAESLLHRQVTWPGQSAAVDLRDYYRSGGRDKTKIKAFQNAMGELKVDGLVGPATKKRYKALTGNIF